MSMTNTFPIEQAALAVLTAEMNYTDAVALRSPTAPAKLVTLNAAQASYEAEILLRTTPTGAIGNVPLTD